MLAASLLTGGMVAAAGSPGKFDYAGFFCDHDVFLDDHDGLFDFLDGYYGNGYVSEHGCVHE